MLTSLRSVIFVCKELVGSGAEIFNALPLKAVVPSVTRTSSVLLVGSVVDEESAFIVGPLNIDVFITCTIGSPWNSRGIVIPVISTGLVVVSSLDLVVDVPDVIVTSPAPPFFESSSLKDFWYFCSGLTLKSTGFFLGSVVTLESSSLDFRSIVSFLISGRSGWTPGISVAPVPGNWNKQFYQLWKLLKILKVDFDRGGRIFLIL